jgi:cytoplasmic iron level regulating protein YaaA (DUF328/UPF0246 family)
MLILLSPAKTLDYETPPQTDLKTAPIFHDRAAQLIEVLKTKTPADIAALMELSDALSHLNVARYQGWVPNPQPAMYPAGIKQAVLAFDGDVYDGLQVRKMTEADLLWMHKHLRILSGLYGILRPLDLMQPHRLEMGTKLKTATAKDLYNYWRSTITPTLAEMAKDAGSPAAIVNLASEEYFGAVDAKALGAQLPLITCVFEEARGRGEFKVISFNAKKARGQMARFAVLNRITDPQQLKTFAEDGYAFAPTASMSTRWVFRRT